MGASHRGRRLAGTVPHGQAHQNSAGPDSAHWISDSDSEAATVTARSIIRVLLVGCHGEATVTRAGTVPALPVTVTGDES